MSQPKQPVESYLHAGHYDLTTPDGVLSQITLTSPRMGRAKVSIENISPRFVGFQLDSGQTFFNLKSTLAQLGLNAKGVHYELDARYHRATVEMELEAFGHLGRLMLSLLEPGCRMGKLFAADDRRRVRDPEYITRMFGRADRWGKPLLSLGGLHGSDDLIIEKLDGRAVAYLSLQNGRIEYNPHVEGFLPTLAAALKSSFSTRDWLRFHQQWQQDESRTVAPDQILLVRTLPLHIRTVFAHVYHHLLTPGYYHTSASVLEPTTQASGDIYELYGQSNREITDIPLEFYTLEPYREHVFFSDRDQLQTCLDDKNAIFRAMETAPKSLNLQTAVFVVKGEQLLNLTEQDWIARERRTHEFPGLAHMERHALMVERFISHQAPYPFLKAIEDGLITSEGILLCRYFPTPLLKRMLLSDQVQRLLQRIYFQYPSQTHGSFFSQEDRALLNDLVSFAIPVYWVDEVTGKVLQYVQRPDKDSGIFVPLNKVNTFLNATVLGVYGSNLLEGDFEHELQDLLKGLLALRSEVNHPFLHPMRHLALVTGGGPGAMEVGNRVAQKLDILSCANIVDFGSGKAEAVINEQRQNPHVEAKMTYRLDKLVERQAEFHLDLPIFLVGGIGTDFEFCLEEVRRKVGSVAPTPILLFGTPDYWREKVSYRFRCNLNQGTIKGSEWLSNCFYCIENAAQGLEVYSRFFKGTLPIGKEGPLYTDGFVDMTLPDPIRSDGSSKGRRVKRH